eukprot:4215830-Alexandrium_andersonii.AAC.1
MLPYLQRQRRQACARGRTGASMGRARRRRAGRPSTRQPWRGLALHAAAPMPVASTTRRETSGALCAGMIFTLTG